MVVVIALFPGGGVASEARGSGADRGGGSVGVLGHRLADPRGAGGRRGERTRYHHSPNHLGHSSTSRR
jgi:hypothetical protein